MKLIIAEKPSVGSSIAKVLGVKNKKDGYYENDAYIISWCVGHLIGLAQSEAYDEKYKKWSITDLPVIPENWLYSVNPATKKQFEILKKLMIDKRVSGAFVMLILYYQHNLPIICKNIGYYTHKY